MKLYVRLREEERAVICLVVGAMSWDVVSLITVLYQCTPVPYGTTFGASESGRAVVVAHNPILPRPKLMENDGKVRYPLSI